MCEVPVPLRVTVRLVAKPPPTASPAKVAVEGFCPVFNGVNAMP